MDITLKVGGDFSSLRRELNRISSHPIKLSGFDSKSISSPLGQINGQLGQFEKSLDASNARVLAFGASAGIIALFTAALKGSVAASIDIEKQLTQINSILGTSTSSLQKFGNDLFEIAKNTGSSFSQVATAANELARQGLGLEETLRRTSDALILTRLTGLDATAAIEAITAAINSFSKEALTSTEIINKLSAVDASFAVSGADLAEALKRVGASAQDAGVDINQLIAIVTSAQQTTARGGAVIGNSFKTIFTRLQRPKVLDQLQELGVATKDAAGSALSAIQVLSNLSTSFDKLSAAQQSSVAELVGGVYQINILKAALGDLSKQNSVYAQALGISNNATNEAIKRNTELNQTLGANLNKAMANLLRVGGSVAGLTLVPALNKVLNGANALLESYDPEGGDAVGQKIGKGILRGIGSFFEGGGLILIGYSIFKLLNKLRSFASDAFKSITGLGDSFSRGAQAQEKMFALLSANPALLKAITSGAMTVEDAHLLILRTIEKQTMALESQLIIAQKLAQAFMKGAPPAISTAPIPPVLTSTAARLARPKGAPKGASKGFVPSFSNLNGSFSKESADIRSGVGGAKTGDKPYLIPSFNFGKGKRGPVVANTGERYVKNYQNKGMGSAILNRDMLAQGAAEGFVPNFNPAPRQRASFANIKKDFPNASMFVEPYVPPSHAKKPLTIAERGREYERQLYERGLKNLGFTDIVDLNARFGTNVQADFLAKKGPNHYLLDAKAGKNDPKSSSVTEKLTTMRALEQSPNFVKYLTEQGIDPNSLKSGIVFGNMRTDLTLGRGNFYREMEKNNLLGSVGSASSGFVPNFAPFMGGEIHDFDDTIVKYPPGMDRKELYTPESIKKATLTPLGEKLRAEGKPINILTARPTESKGPIEEFLKKAGFIVNEVVASGSLYNGIKTQGVRGLRNLTMAEKKSRFLEETYNKYGKRINITDDRRDIVSNVQGLKNPNITATHYDYKEEEEQSKNLKKQSQSFKKINKKTPIKTASGMAGGFVPNFGPVKADNRIPKSESSTKGGKIVNDYLMSLEEYVKFVNQQSLFSWANKNNYLKDPKRPITNIEKDDQIHTKLTLEQIDPLPEVKRGTPKGRAGELAMMGKLNADKSKPGYVSTSDTFGFKGSELEELRNKATPPNQRQAILANPNARGDAVEIGPVRRFLRALARPFQTKKQQTIRDKGIERAQGPLFESAQNNLFESKYTGAGQGAFRAAEQNEGKIGNVEFLRNHLGKTGGVLYDGSFKEKELNKRDPVANNLSSFIIKEKSKGFVPNFAPVQVFHGTNNPNFAKEIKASGIKGLKTAVKSKSSLGSSFLDDSDLYDVNGRGVFVSMDRSTAGKYGKNIFSTTVDDSQFFNYDEKSKTGLGANKFYSETRKSYNKSTKGLIGGKFHDTEKAEDTNKFLPNFPNTPVTQNFVLSRGLKNLNFTKELSEGFVPNFNSEALSSAMSRENQAGIPRSEIRVDTNSSLVTSRNPEGLGVFNEEEGSLKNGISLAVAAGINPKTKGMAGGFVPNFVSTPPPTETKKSTETKTETEQGMSGSLMTLSFALPQVVSTLGQFAASTEKAQKAFDQVGSSLSGGIAFGMIGKDLLAQGKSLKAEGRNVAGALATFGGAGFAAAAAFQAVSIVFTYFRYQSLKWTEDITSSAEAIKEKAQKVNDALSQFALAQSKWTDSLKPGETDAKTLQKLFKDMEKKMALIPAEYRNLLAGAKNQADLQDKMNQIQENLNSKAKQAEAASSITKNIESKTLTWSGDKWGMGTRDAFSKGKGAKELGSTSDDVFKNIDYIKFSEDVAKGNINMGMSQTQLSTALKKTYGASELLGDAMRHLNRNEFQQLQEQLILLGINSSNASRELKALEVHQKKMAGIKEKQNIAESQKRQKVEDAFSVLDIKTERERSRKSGLDRGLNSVSRKRIEYGRDLAAPMLSEKGKAELDFKIKEIEIKGDFLDKLEDFQNEAKKKSMEELRRLGNLEAPKNEDNQANFSAQRAQFQAEIARMSPGQVSGDFAAFQAQVQTALSNNSAYLQKGLGTDGQLLRIQAELNSNILKSQQELIFANRLNVLQLDYQKQMARFQKDLKVAGGTESFMDPERNKESFDKYLIGLKALSQGSNAKTKGRGAFNTMEFLQEFGGIEGDDASSQALKQTAIEGNAVRIYEDLLRAASATDMAARTARDPKTAMQLRDEASNLRGQAGRAYKISDNQVGEKLKLNKMPQNIQDMLAEMKALNGYFDNKFKGQMAGDFSAAIKDSGLIDSVNQTTSAVSNLFNQEAQGRAETKVMEATTVLAAKTGVVDSAIKSIGLKKDVVSSQMTRAFAVKDLTLDQKKAAASTVGGIESSKVDVNRGIMSLLSSIQKGAMQEGKDIKNVEEIKSLSPEDIARYLKRAGMDPAKASEKANLLFGRGDENNVLKGFEKNTLLTQSLNDLLNTQNSLINANKDLTQATNAVSAAFNNLINSIPQGGSVTPGLSSSVSDAQQAAGTAQGQAGNFASGFVPNFSSLNHSFAKESADIRSGVGGAKSGDTPYLIPNFNFGDGKRGSVVANTGEVYVKNYENRGSAILNRDMLSKPTAKGFIPNLAPTAISRALNTEKKIGGKGAVLDYDRSIGSFVRQPSQPSNLSSLLKRDHPEGLQSAMQNSAASQGVSAAGGFISNFAPSNKAAAKVEQKLQAMISTQKLIESEEGDETIKGAVERYKVPRTDNFWSREEGLPKEMTVLDNVLAKGANNNAKQSLNYVRDIIHYQTGEFFKAVQEAHLSDPNQLWKILTGPLSYILWNLADNKTLKKAQKTAIDDQENGFATEIFKKASDKVDYNETQKPIIEDETLETKKFERMFGVPEQIHMGPKKKGIIQSFSPFLNIGTNIPDTERSFAALNVKQSALEFISDEAPIFSGGWLKINEEDMLGQFGFTDRDFQVVKPTLANPRNEIDKRIQEINKNRGATTSDLSTGLVTEAPSRLISLGSGYQRSLLSSLVYAKDKNGITNILNSSQDIPGDLKLDLIEKADLFRRSIEEAKKIVRKSAFDPNENKKVAINVNEGELINSLINGDYSKAKTLMRNAPQLTQNEYGLLEKQKIKPSRLALDEPLNIITRKKIWQNKNAQQELIAARGSFNFPVNDAVEAVSTDFGTMQNFLSYADKLTKGTTTGVNSAETNLSMSGQNLSRIAQDQGKYPIEQVNQVKNDFIKEVSKLTGSFFNPKTAAPALVNNSDVGQLARKSVMDGINLSKTNKAKKENEAREKMAREAAAQKGIEKESRRSSSGFKFSNRNTRMERRFRESQNRSYEGMRGGEGIWGMQNQMQFDNFGYRTMSDGFIPNLAPTAISRALNAEKKVGGKGAVLDYDRSIGSFVRQPSQPSNLNSLLKKDHPEGLQAAMQNSAASQGLSAARGFIPNFGFFGDMKEGYRTVRNTISPEFLLSKKEIARKRADEATLQDSMLQRAAGQNDPLAIRALGGADNIRSESGDFVNQLTDLRRMGFGGVSEGFTKNANTVKSLVLSVGGWDFTALKEAIKAYPKEGAETPKALAAFEKEINTQRENGELSGTLANLSFGAAEFISNYLSTGGFGGGAMTSRQGMKMLARPRLLKPGSALGGNALRRKTLALSGRAGSAYVAGGTTIDEENQGSFDREGGLQYATLMTLLGVARQPLKNLNTGGASGAAKEYIGIGALGSGIPAIKREGDAVLGDGRRGAQGYIGNEHKINLLFEDLFSFFSRAGKQKLSSEKGRFLGGESPKDNKDKDKGEGPLILPSILNENRANERSDPPKNVNRPSSPFAQRALGDLNPSTLLAPDEQKILANKARGFVPNFDSRARGDDAKGDERFIQDILANEEKAVLDYDRSGFGSTPKQNTGLTQFDSGRPVKSGLNKRPTTKDFSKALILGDPTQLNSLALGYQHSLLRSLVYQGEGRKGIEGLVNASPDIPPGLKPDLIEKADLFRGSIEKIRSITQAGEINQSKLIDHLIKEEYPLAEKLMANAPVKVPEVKTLLQEIISRRLDLNEPLSLITRKKISGNRNVQQALKTTQGSFNFPVIDAVEAVSTDFNTMATPLTKADILTRGTVTNTKASAATNLFGSGQNLSVIAKNPIQDIDPARNNFLTEARKLNGSFYEPKSETLALKNNRDVGHQARIAVMEGINLVKTNRAKKENEPKAKAKGFIPNLAPATISRDLNTEKKMGGKGAVLDYDRSGFGSTPKQNTGLTQFDSGRPVKVKSSGPLSEKDLETLIKEQDSRPFDLAGWPEKLFPNLEEPRGHIEKPLSLVNQNQPSKLLSKRDRRGIRVTTPPPRRDDSAFFAWAKENRRVADQEAEERLVKSRAFNAEAMRLHNENGMRTMGGANQNPYFNRVQYGQKGESWNIESGIVDPRTGEPRTRMGYGGMNHFVPNFSNLNRSFAKESTDIRSGVGGAKSGDVPYLIPNFNFGDGKRGPVVANTGEVYVKNYENRGSAILNRDMLSKTAANGFIPNSGTQDFNLSGLEAAISELKTSLQQLPTIILEMSKGGSSNSSISTYSKIDVGGSIDVTGSAEMIKEELRASLERTLMSKLEAIVAEMSPSSRAKYNSQKSI